MQKLNMTAKDKTLIMINTRRCNRLYLLQPRKPHFYQIMFTTPTALTGQLHAF